jgi:hypothetical protein
LKKSSPKDDLVLVWKVRELLESIVREALTDGLTRFEDGITEALSETHYDDQELESIVEVSRGRKKNRKIGLTSKCDRRILARNFLDYISGAVNEEKTNAQIAQVEFVARENDELIKRLFDILEDWTKERV